ncbi:hypothetical protein [Fusobacterium nucleatum]|uniref:Uncharacterized protein n=1 Tax=Fusobacterium nucleatum subsp. nucleatum (strain ATCC 25586 / DSM 15643 / BCRC 10681 / CIP 101130 / JCM 8532 / KCTC 2640 / LMG 13131 / VPI 4355) TaxID=190304 RepID=Q8REP7_FUSNN|nr:hypothetical protein [Fusobacterium nucleatum]AAL95247.1 unknown [Fusobacterium nucleatum subsp. nucleatum ATCC 25586]ALF25507.1 hypothetical protein RN95_03280 [Fusobacterium nucleatum subsp. nucleatum]AVQ15406.1 hypothetical protein C7Y58_08275 [Fusobacterium nucleatum subsp. nucleatum ATCC 25586]WMS30329.1 hypothetical protein RDV57_04495 [Fusobacterium nucleatum]
MNKDFDNNILDFTKRKKALKLILFLLVISLVVLVVQLFFKDSLSFSEGNLTIINSFVAFILLFLYITLTADMYVTIKRIKEREKIEVPNEFRVDGFKQTYFIILYIIVLLSALALVFASIITGQNIVMTLMGIVITIIVSTYIYSMIKNTKFSLEVKNKNIKIFYKNQEIGTFEIEDISFVAFSGSGGQKVKKGDYPIMAVYSLRGEEFLRMPLSLRNYWLMKKYFLKYNIDIEDSYNL